MWEDLACVDIVMVDLEYKPDIFALIFNAS